MYSSLKENQSSIHDILEELIKEVQQTENNFRVQQELVIRACEQKLNEERQQIQQDRQKWQRERARRLEKEKQLKNLLKKTKAKFEKISDNLIFNFFIPY